jgi:hypothetical protein
MMDGAGQISGEVEKAPGLRPAAGSGTRRRWIAACVVALLVHVLAFWLFTVSSLPAERPVTLRPRLFWAGAKVVTPESALGEQLALFDSAPLFLPTRWNAAGREGGVREDRSPLEIFDPYRERLSVDENRRPEVLRVFPSFDRDPAVYVSRFSWPALAAFGRADGRAAGAVAPRIARVEIWSIAEGTLAYERDVMPAELPASASWPEWQPMEALIVVESVGVLGPPLVVRTSGSDLVDGFFRDQIIGRMQPGLILPAGYYRVSIGP